MPGLQPERLVVPIDHSELAWEALARAIEIAGDASKVHAVHVLAPLMAMEPGVVYGTVTDESRIRSSADYLREQLAEHGHEGVTLKVIIGDAGREITDYAAKVSADLIVIPSHGRGFVKHMLLGSVAERVIRLARCPVLVLRS